MLSIGAVASPAAAGSYFGKDDYYAAEDSQPSLWMGEGAVALGLEGRVDRAAFEAVLEGRVPGEERRLGFAEDGVWKHRPGWDLTFSAPKSVSIMAEVAGDERLIAAHDRAVAAALAHAEETASATQAKREGRVVSEPTGNLVAAAFRHDLSRNQDPQLHTHVVVANMTQTARGWRSLDSKPLYDNAKSLGIAYQQALALEVRALGYEVEPRANGTFEIRGVEAGAIKTFSSRRAEIVARLDAMGGARNASPADAAKAALATRRRKGVITRDEAARVWRGALSPDQAAAIEALRGTAVERARAGGVAPTRESRETGAASALKAAIATLSERDAAFSTERTLALANRLAVGRADHGDVRRALDRAVASGDATAKTVIEADRRSRRDEEKAGLTTATLQAVERDMLGREAAGRGQAARLASGAAASRIVAAAEARAAAEGHAWTDDQRAAATGLLASRNRVHAVQGYAGTAKTTTVLTVYAAEAARAGKDVRALAPTASAAQTLGRAIGRATTREAATVDRLLANVALGRNPAIQNRFARAEQVWIVDEASLLSSAKLRDLFKAAEAEMARVVLVGDVRQLGSVEAGYGFGQLQRAGMPTERLERIVRQTNAPLRQAVERAAQGEAARAMDHFVRTPDALTEAATPQERYDAVAVRWLGLTPEQRATTLVIEPSREGRAAITARIRDGLLAEGALGATRVDALRLESKGLTAAERRQPMHYARGDVVTFQRAYDFGGTRLERGAPARVLAASQADGTVTLKPETGPAFDWRPERKGAGKAQVHAARPADLRAGDRIVWTRNDARERLVNGLRGTVSDVDPAARRATVTFADGRTRMVALDSHAGRHWRHDYAQTVHAAQGATSERVIVHAESWRINLVTERSFYVAISRAKESGHLVTDDKGKLADALAHRAGQKETALDRLEAERHRAAVTPPPGLRQRAEEVLREALRADAWTMATPLAKGPRRSLARDKVNELDRRPQTPERDVAGGPDAAKEAGREPDPRKTPDRDVRSMEELRRIAERSARDAARQTRDASRGFER